MPRLNKFEFIAFDDKTRKHEISVADKIFYDFSGGLPVVSIDATAAEKIVFGNNGLRPLPMVVRVHVCDKCDHKTVAIGYKKRDK